MRKVHLLVAVALGLFSVELSAQTAFLLPGPNGTNTTVTVLTVTPFTQIATLNATMTATNVLSRADGSEYYIISNAASNTVMTTTSALGSVQTLASLGAAATAAVRTPDGQKILIAAGNLWVINTANDTLANPSGINVGGTAVDVASSIDSTRAFVLVNTGTGFILNAIDLRSLQSAATLQIGGQPSGVVVGPNGLVYVGTSNALLEIDPTTLSVRNTIVTNGLPGKLSFTPDGSLGVAVNQTPVTALALFVFDLNAKAVSATTSFFTTTVIPNPLSQIFVVSTTRALAYSSTGQTLYSIQLNPQSASPFQQAAAGQVSLVAATNDFANTTGSPAGTHTTTKYLLYVSSGVLYEYDIAANQIVGQVSISGTVGALAIATPANTAGFPVSVLAYGDQQTVPLGGNSAPLVVRAVDANGKPVVGVGVTFSTSSAATLSVHSGITNDDGQVAVTVTAPSVAGQIQVLANVGSGLSYTFTVNVGGTSGGGGGGGGGGGTGTPAGLTILNGQGALIPGGAALSGNPTDATMAVLYSDSKGNPIPGANITFNQTAGAGSLQCAVSSTIVFTCSQTSTASMTVTTDSNGIARADYLTSVVLPSNVQGFNQDTVVASPTTGTAVTFYINSFPPNNPPTLNFESPSFSDILKGSAGQTLTGAVLVKVSSGLGPPIPNASLRILKPPDPTKGPSAQCAGGFALSDPTGLASCDLVLSGLTGSTTLTEEVGYLQDNSPINISVTGGVPGKINILQGNNQTGKPGQVLPQSFLAQVTDATGNPLPLIAVNWKVLNGTITLSQVSSTTDSNGKASAQGTLGNTPGTAQVQVTAGSGSSQVSATFTVTITAPIAGITLVSGNNQTTLVNTAFANPLQVNATDSTGKPVSGVPVSFTVTSGSATVATPNATTDANGNASTTVTAGGTAGAVVITANSSGFSVTFNLTVSPPGPTNVIFLNGASLQPGAAAGAIVTIQGSGLANGVNGVVLPNNVVGPLPTTLAGVTVTFNGKSAPIFSVSNVNGVQQVTVQVPYEVAGLATASVVITTPGGGSGIFTVTLQTYSPGIFTTNLFGLANQVVAIHLSDGSYVSPTNPAHRGEVIIFFVTGAGQTTPLTGTGDAGIPNQNIAANIAVGFNNAGVPYLSAQTVVGLIGVYAITLQVPSDATPGPSQPVGFIVYDNAGNSFFANSPVIPIQ